ncbi:MAG: DNA primase [Chloroflexi bacterium]|nr:DNA primase [Chloroflexota bacterium]
MSVIDDIKARLDIVDIVSAYTPLKKAGRNYKALCPFHGEKTPSFVVFPDRQSWRCFGACNEGGDIFGFVMKAEGWDFPETLRVLAERAGVELRPQTPEENIRHNTEERLLALLDGAAQLFTQHLLESPDAEAVRAYVTRRGLNETTIRQFNIGYAPDSWHFALNHFRLEGYREEELLEAGLAIRNETGRVYDRFRHRLMIPIRDGRGRTLGFGARALADDQQPKYLNSPQGPLFNKSNLLYGLDLARRAIRESETVVIVEGYMDVIQAHQAGYTNVVAQMGTALTPTQVQQVAKYANRLILALDSDAAGVNATMRGLKVTRDSLVEAEPEGLDARGMMSQAGKLQLDIRVLQLPSGKDPDEFIRANPEQWPEVVNQARPLVDYVIEIGTRHLPPNADIYARERVARDLLPLLTATESDLQRNDNIQRLAVRLHIPERDLLNWVHAAGGKKSAPLSAHRPQPKGAGKGSNAIGMPRRNGHLNQPGAALERYCLSMLLQAPDRLFQANRKLRELAAQEERASAALLPLNQEDFSREDYRALFRLINEALNQDEYEPNEFIEECVPQELKGTVEEIQPHPLEIFRQKASNLHLAELQSVMKDLSRFNGEAELQSVELFRCVFELRQQRLKREMSDFYFFEREAQLDSEDTLVVDYSIIKAHSLAIHLLERAHHELVHQRQEN